MEGIYDCKDFKKCSTFTCRDIGNNRMCKAEGVLCSGNTSRKNAETPEIVEEPKLKPEDADGTFSIAVIPDTQQEVVVKHAIENKHFLNRTRWLAENKEELDLRCVVHTGDVVNWGNEDRTQLEIASEAMSVLTAANIPTALCLGNHDTAAVGVGGGAADAANTRTRVRDTTAFNEYFTLDEYSRLRSQESGKIDNTILRFKAGGAKWMVVCLELWPREEIINWAKIQVENRPDYNVIIATHSFLKNDGTILQNNGGYGANSPQYLYDNLIKKYENIKFVLCGHTGTSFVREDIGDNGNKIVTLLGAFHRNDKNPVKIVNIDVNNGKIDGYVYSPIDQHHMEQHDFSVEGLEFIKSQE